jgi:hypothetical protein
LFGVRSKYQISDFDSAGLLLAPELCALLDGGEVI